MNQNERMSEASNDHPSEQKTVVRPGISELFTFASFVVWCLNASTNGVFNFFSDSPGFQLYPSCFAFSIGLMFSATKFVVRRKNIPWLFMLATVFCVVLFVISSEAVRRKEARIAAVTSPNVPWIEIKTQGGLSGPIAGGEITSEMNRVFRE